MVKRIRMFTSLALALALVLGFAAPSFAEGYKIAIVLKTLSNPFWVSMKEGIQEEAKKLGVTVDVYAVPTEDDSRAQAELLESILQKGYNGIGVAPLTPVNLIPAVAKATKMEIPVINIDNAIDQTELAKQGGKVISLVATNNFKVGAQAAEFVVKTLGAKGGEVAIIEGIPGAVSSNDRRDGFKSAIEKTPGFKLVAIQPANWDRMTALNVATNLLQRFPRLKAIYCANDTMALGAAQAAINAGRKDVLVVGTDGIPEAVTAIEEGRLTATIAQDPKEIGAQSLRMLVDYLKGKQIPARYDVPSVLVVK